MIVLDWRRFDEKYGKGSRRELHGYFADPRIRISEIAQRFDVSEDAVADWYHVLELDYAILDRRKLGIEERRKARQLEMFRDKFLPRMFYRFVEIHCPDVQVELIPRPHKKIDVRVGAVKLDGKMVLLRKATRRRVQDATKAETYRIWNPQEHADYIFLLLRHENFLLVPQCVLPQYDTTYTDSPRSSYFRYRNNFHALTDQRLGYNGNRPQSSKT